MDTESRKVSLRLWDVLERIGVSERVRQLHRETSICDEIVGTILDRTASVYRFGSSSEGTTTPGMNSDRDVVTCDESFPVIHEIEQATLETPICLLAVSDPHTKPGYCKLQLVKEGIPLTVHNRNIDRSSSFCCVYDCAGRVCVKHFTTLGRDSIVNERSGPADTTHRIPGYYTSLDSVFALRSKEFPHIAKESLLQCFESGWLTRDEFEKMMTFGCLYVGVGHPSSTEKDLEWRVSFSLQERYLTFSFNVTQHKCLVLMKIIKDILTSKPDVGKSITSYHCKTCLFSVITKTTSAEWVPETLIHCTLTCLAELRQRLSDGNCPNFFIKANNMFDRRIHGHVKDRLIRYLSELLNEGFRLFYHIQSDYIGEILNGDAKRRVDSIIQLGVYLYRLYTNMCQNLLYHQTVICNNLHKISNKEGTLYLFKKLVYLVSVDTVTEHTKKETRKAVMYLQPFVHTLYAQHIASLAFSADAVNSRHHLLQVSVHHLRHAMTWDLLSGRIIFVVILYRQGNVDMCCEFLEHIEKSLNEEVISVCDCHFHQRHMNVSIVDRMLSRGNHPDPRFIMSTYMATCTLFLPSHVTIIPLALHYEMYRAVGTPSRSRDDVYDAWFSWCAVDSKVLLYFMQYLVYSDLNKSDSKRVATRKLWTVLQNDQTLGHRETGYNLLGWIYSQERQIEAAAYCFLQSWKIRPQHNAAKWHMLNLIYQQYQERQ